MPQRISVSAASRGNENQITCFSGEGLEFAFTGLTAGQSVIVAIGPNLAVDPTIQREDAVSVKLSAEDLAILPVGEPWQYMLWLNLGAGDQVVMRFGKIVRRESLEPIEAPLALAAPAITGLPVISGTETEGEVLTASAADVTGNPAPARTWQWERAGVAIPGATAATYTLQAADVGETLTVVQTETNSEGTASAESAATGAIAAAPPALAAPAITGLPVISGTETEGEVLTASAADVTGNPAPARTWQWERAGVAIPGATAATYTLQAADVGETLTVVQTETNSEGTASAESAATGVIAAAAVTMQRIVGIMDSNTAGGDDSAGSALDPALDEDPRIRFLDPATGSLIAIDATAPIPRPGGDGGTSTTPAINFAKEVADTGVTPVLVQTAVGGTGTYNLSPVPTSGAWDPDGAGPAWQIGGTPPESQASGALYLAHASGMWPNATSAAITAESPGAATPEPIFFGPTVSANDVGGPFSVLLSRARRLVTDLRGAWSAPSAPFVMFPMPPEFAYAGPRGREVVSAISSIIAQQMPHVAYVEGPGGMVHPTEAIHYSNAGYRALGTKAAGAIAVAQARSTPPGRWFDWIDGLSQAPARVYALYRLVAGYAGPAFRLSNGSTEIDIAFMADGLPDFAAMEAHVGSGDGWITRIYDQLGSGIFMVPEGSGNAWIMRAGQPLFQGRRLAWGDDQNNILMMDTSFSGTSAGAMLAVGRINNAGNTVQADMNDRTFSLFAQGGVTKFAIDGATEDLVTPQAREPDFVAALAGSPGGYNLWANYIDGGGMRANGQAVASVSGTALTTGAAGTLAWGGRPGATNRYSNGSHFALIAWETAPSGADLAAVDAWAASIAAVDDLDVAA